jgi:hypothetical protein
MIPSHYKERYKRILHKDKITKEEVKEFLDAVSHYTVVFPNWKKQELS